jgi:asparagine synthase (glutamine-hydrolysing)
MCGIAVYVNKKKEPTNLYSIISSMTELVSHRGPDGSGYFFGDNFAFGHQRLAVIDLSDDAVQPMQYMSGLYTITYNGEIYNYIELKNDLIKLGYRFRSQSDTEVVLAAYCHWREKCVERFNGMWSFVIYDHKRQILFGTRDRFGVKPFYFTDQISFFAAGSEIRQLLRILPAVKANQGILIDFLLTGFTDHTEQSFFDGIQKLLPGHNLIYDLKNHRLSTHPYYRIKHRPEIHKLREEEGIDYYGAVLKDAVRLRMRSDVKVGTCLSGGLDSSSVATLAAEIYSNHSTEMFSAITAVSEQKSNDESSYASLVVKHSNLKWIQVKPSYRDFCANLQTVIKAQEEPFVSPSIFMQYFVMRAAKENGVTVLLDGQGGDETLLGYERYYAAYYVSLLRRHGITAAIKGVKAAHTHNARMEFLTSLKYVVGGLSASARYWFYRIRHRYLSASDYIPWQLRAYAKACLDEFALQELEICRTNLPALLRFEDKNSMAHSVETRLPFIDYRAVEIALSLPSQFKIRDGWSKWVLRCVMNGAMPDEIVWRKNKIGFEAPDEIWLARHLPEMVHTVTESALLRSVANMELLVSMYPRMDKRSQWRLYSVAMWENVFSVMA